jgi:hypothetical protein
MVKNLLAMDADDFKSFNEEIGSTMIFIEANFDTLKSMPKRTKQTKTKVKSNNTRMTNNPDQATPPKRKKAKSIYVQSDSDIK